MGSYNTLVRFPAGALRAIVAPLGGSSANPPLPHFVASLFAVERSHRLISTLVCGYTIYLKIYTAFGRMRIVTEHAIKEDAKLRHFDLLVSSCLHLFDVCAVL